MTHRASSPPHASPNQPNQSSCTRVPKIPSGEAPPGPPTSAHSSATNTDLDMTENRVDSDDVEHISSKKTCDDSSSSTLVKENSDPASDLEVVENTKENIQEKPTEENEEAEQFGGQIVYNPDGSAFILEESDETLLDQLPTQEGAIVEGAGPCSSVTEYPKIDQGVYVARRRAWYNAMGSAYRQMMQGSTPSSPVVHNFRVVQVASTRQHLDEPEEPNKGEAMDHRIGFPFIAPVMCIIGPANIGASECPW